jgi:hypothetical protein
VAKAKDKPPRKRRRTEQLHIEGTEPEYDRELDDAAWAYYEVMKERCQQSKDEKRLKTHLIDKMKEKGIGRYETKNGLIIVVSDTAHVSAKPKESTPLTAEDGEDSGEE